MLHFVPGMIAIWHLQKPKLHTHTRTRARTRARTHARTHTHTQTRTHARTHAHTHTHSRTHAHTNTHARTHARTHTHSLTHARTHAHTHTRTHAHSYSLAFPFHRSCGGAGVASDLLPYLALFIASTGLRPAVFRSLVSFHLVSGRAFFLLPGMLVISTLFTVFF